MDSPVGHYGYNADFINPVPATMKCAACRFVLRDAVEIANCGHRYCKDCFIRMKSYASNFDSQIRCKIDKNTIDIDQVFPNANISLMIQKLDVKCSYAKVGCPWTGVLENVENHEASCQFSMRPFVPSRSNVKRVVSSSDSMLKELSKRLTQCEIGLSKKDDEVFDIKTKLNDTKALVFQREDEINELKVQNKILQTEINSLQGRITMNFEKDIATLKSEVLLCKDVHFTNTNDIRKLKGQVEESLMKQSMRDSIKSNSITPKEVQVLNDQMNKMLRWNENMDKILNNNNKEDEFKELSLKFEKLLNTKEDPKNDDITDVQVLKYEVNDIVAWKNDIDRLICRSAKDADLQDLKTEVENLRLLCMESAKLNDGISSVQLWKDQIDMQVYRIQKQCETTCHELDCIHRHLSDIENHELWKKYMTQQNTVFVWKIYCYQQYAFTETLYSPLFYSCADGNICQLLIEWTDQEYLSLFLRICKGSRSEPVLPLKQSYEFHVEKENGEEFKTKIGYDDARKETSFVFINDNPYTKGFGFTKYLKRDEIEKYLTDDTLSITCTLLPVS